MLIKVYDLAKEFRMTNTEMVNVLGKQGFGKLSPSSDLDEETATKARAALQANLPAGSANGSSAVATAPSPSPSRSGRPAPSGGGGNGSNSTTANGNGNGASARTVAPPPAPSGAVVEVPENVSVKELAERMGIGANEIQKVLMGFGVLAALNQRLAPDAVQRIAQKMGRTIRTAAPAPAKPVQPALAPAPVSAPATGKAGNKPAANGDTPTVKPGRTATTAAVGRPADGMVARPPVVTIMGHVDHGKTTLLDALRKTSVASGEAGGITQHIGAYQIERDGKKITFLDTPGHAAFSAMRARGASVTDIVIIVVAADDSIMPQTEEAIQHAKDAGVPIIVAVNKIDLPDANPDKVLTDMTRYDLVPEAYGGDVLTVNISAKTGQGLDELIETILLVTEAAVEPKANPHAKAEGTIIEARLDKGRGPVVTVLVQQGTLRMGDVLVAGEQFGKIRTMTDDKGGKLIKALPSTPVEIVGLGAVPDAGDHFEVVKDEKEARSIAGQREQAAREERLGGRNLVTLEALYKVMRQGAVKELNVVIKGDVQGSVQAVRDSIKDLGNDEVRVRILSTGVGAIGENDVLIAAADKEADTKESNSMIVGFNVGFATGADKKAEQEHVTVKMFSIIYELIDAVKEAMVALLPPIYEENPLGKAEVRQLFRLPGGRVIAGCYVNSGLIRRNAKVRVLRGKDTIHTGDIDTLKRIKDDAREVASGYECGLTVRDFNLIQIGDILDCFEMRQLPREL